MQNSENRKISCKMGKNSLSIECSLIIILSALILILGTTKNLQAQKTEIFQDRNELYNRAVDLFAKEKYSVAQKHFVNYSKISNNPLLKLNAEYYSGVCAVELQNKDAISILNSLISRHSEMTQAKLAWYQLGRWYYRTKDYKTAVECLDKVPSEALAGNDLAEYYFINGYCLFKVDRFDEAKAAFKNIKDDKALSNDDREKYKRYIAANYYYAYVCYRQASYDEALTHFARVKEHKTFGPLSSIYVSQIYFARKQYDKVITYADTISNSDVADEVAGILGQSYYQLGEHSKAIPYLERFMQKPPVVPVNSDLYRLGYCYFINKQFDKAIDQFLKIPEDNDTLTQYVYYHLAKSYIETKKKNNARIAFEKAANEGINEEIKENALYNTAKLSYELSLQNLALQAYSKFFETYPESELADQAKSEMSSLLMTTKNYKEALKFLENIKRPNLKDKTALQRVQYYRAEELFLNNEYDEAKSLFLKASQVDFDKRIYALGHFWNGEIAFREGMYDNAISSFNKFQFEDAVKPTRFYNLSFYDIGYSFLKKEDYNKAIENFKKYLERDANIANPEVYTDATIRIADCYLILKNYEKSIEYYNMVFEKKLSGSDYALMQKATILGVTGQTEEKVNTLRLLMKSFPKSTYIDDALYDLANVYLQGENYSSALVEFNNLITNYPRSVFVRKALLNKALVLFNQSKDDESLATLKTLITNYQNSDEAREAMIIIKNIFVNKGQSEEYLEFIKVLPNVVISASTQDSISYESAFNLYKINDCEKASKAFANYINKFPGGYFILKANYFKAECDFTLKNNDAALIAYEYVSNSIRNDYTERATRQCAVLYFMKKNYDKAFEYYSALERIAGNKDNLSIALLGQMKCSSLQGKIDSAAAASFKYINSTIAQKDGLIDAHLNMGRFFMKREKTDSALSEFQYVVKETKSVAGAESKYNIAYIQFLRDELKTSQKTIFELSDNYSSFEYWTAKGFILLSDVYLKSNDNFQAKATLQSIISNYEGEELKNIAIAKLKNILAEEDKKKLQQKKNIEKRINEGE